MRQGTAVWWGIIRCGSFFSGKMHKKTPFCLQTTPILFQDFWSILPPNTHHVTTIYPSCSIIAASSSNSLVLCLSEKKRRGGLFFSLAGTRTVADINPGSERGLSVRTAGGAIVFNTTPRRVRVYSIFFCVVLYIVCNYVLYILPIIYMIYNEYDISYDIWRWLFGLVLRFQILLKLWYLFRHGEFFQPPRLHCQALSYTIRIWYVLLSAAQLGTRLCSTQRHDVWDSLQHPPLQLWCLTQSRYRFIVLTQ